MAALSRPTEATYTIHENVTVDTEDREDHTFCGIMFPVKAKSVLPVHSLVINQISVRGRLGPITVWVTNDDDEEGGSGISPAERSASAPPPAAGCASAFASSSFSSHRYNLRSRSASGPSSSSPLSSSSRRAAAVANRQISMRQSHWTKIYSRTHPVSFRDYTPLDLSASPVILRPGQVRGIYVHSTLEGDEAIVYDNKHKDLTHDDGFLTVMPGRAHVSEAPFGSTPIWGWGNAWRDNREFVGRISYGAVYRLWNPAEYAAFGDKFRGLTRGLFLCQRRWESPFSMLPDDCIFFILNMCRWDWADDDVEGMREEERARRAEKRRREREERERERLEEEQRRIERERAAAVRDDEEKEDEKMGAVVSSEELASAVVEESDRPGGGGEDDDDDDDEEEEMHEVDDSDEDDSDYDMEYDEYRNMNTSTFYYRDHDDDDDSVEERRRAAVLQEENRRRSWIRSQFARIHVLRALASMNDGQDEGIFE